MWVHYSLIIMCLDIGTPNNHGFPFRTNGKIVVLGVPIFKHFRVELKYKDVSSLVTVVTVSFFPDLGQQSYPIKA